MTEIITPQLIDEAIRTKDQSLAVELLATDKNTNALDEQTRLQLQYLRLNSLSTDSVARLLTQSILAAYSLPEFSLAEKFKALIEQYDYVPDAIALCAKVPALLNNNQELLGEQPIVLGGKKVPPTISNWLNHYALYSTGRSGHDILAVMKYFNTNTDLKVLSAKQKSILKDLIQLQDYCLEAVQLWESLPDNLQASDVETLTKDLNLNPLSYGVDDIEFSDGSEQEQLPPIQPVKVSENTPSFQIPGQRDMDLSTEKSGGLVFDQPTNVNLDSEMQKRAEDKRNQAAIQAKLEALKKRQGIDEESK